MPDLIAQGNEPQLRWQRRIPTDKPFVIGRASGSWSVPWDNHVSRSHVTAEWHVDRLRIQKLPTAKNPVFYQGNPSECFEITAGSHFVIGATLFTLVDEVESPDVPEPPMTEQTYSSAFLKKIQYRDSSRRVNVLGRLPEVIAGATDDDELFRQIVSVLLSGIPEAATVGIVEMKVDTNELALEVLHWEQRQRDRGHFSPSRRLVKRAIESNESVLHIWDLERSQSLGNFTLMEDTLWSFATPIRDVAPVGKRWSIYVAGKPGLPTLDNKQNLDESALQEDMKFTELAASTISNLLKLRQLERNQTSLRQFFGPVVLQALAGADPEEVLRPRETEVAVMFCDLRGFSSAAEAAADDLMGLLDRVSRVLGLTTHHIHEFDGVIGDFHGDAAMGFWGWPIASGDFVARACRAALEIRRELESNNDDETLFNFRMGVGMATGRAVAGKIGTQDQVKVTVFGPVANLASRLEGMTRKLRTPILIDNETATYVRATMDPSTARVRRIAQVIPYGMSSPVMVHELLPPESESKLETVHLNTYEQALDAFIIGDWETAWMLLHRVPATDEVKDFLYTQIAKLDRKPPPNWNGIIRFDSKR